MENENNSQKKENNSCRISDFLNGIEAAKSIEWTRESEEIERALKEYGYK